jgi:hypothetical protein
MWSSHDRMAAVAPSSINSAELLNPTDAIVWSWMAALAPRAC